jgi:hypothetical protein
LQNYYKDDAYRSVLDLGLGDKVKKKGNVQGLITGHLKTWDTLGQMNKTWVTIGRSKRGIDWKKEIEGLARNF